MEDRQVQDSRSPLYLDRNLHVVFSITLMAVMGVIILFRLWVDWLASKFQGIETAFRPHLPGLISLGLSTTLFGTPYGYPAQSIHDSKPGYATKESRIAGARIVGILFLLLPFRLLPFYTTPVRGLPGGSAAGSFLGPFPRFLLPHTGSPQPPSEARLIDLRPPP